MKCMCAQTRLRFILLSEGVMGGMEFEPMLTPREKSPLPENVPRGGSNPRRCGQRTQALPTELFRPPTPHPLPPPQPPQPPPPPPPPPDSQYQPDQIFWASHPCTVSRAVTCCYPTPDRPDDQDTQTDYIGEVSTISVW